MLVFDTFSFFGFVRQHRAQEKKNIVLGPKMKPSSGWAVALHWLSKAHKDKRGLENSARAGSVFLLDCFDCTYRDWVHVDYITKIGYIVWNYTTIDIATNKSTISFLFHAIWPPTSKNGLPFKNYFHHAKWPQTIQKLASFCSYNIYGHQQFKKFSFFFFFFSTSTWLIFLALVSFLTPQLVH